MPLPVARFGKPGLIGRRHALLTALACAAVPAPGRPAQAAQAAIKAPLFEGLGGPSHDIETRHPLARRYFDQGMLLVYGFNVAEAVRSFEATLAIAPDCASAWWALAWALGPHIKIDMPAEHHLQVQRALRQARQHAHRAPAWRRDLIAALSLRHPGGERLDEQTYAQRMQDLARRHARQADVALLAAQALLNLHPDDWWEGDGSAKPWTPAIEALLQHTLQLAPKHPGAHHYWIHLQESSAQPQRAESSAEALRDAYPGSAHLLHMPSHIDMRLGQYAKAVQANQRAIEADLRYLTRLDVPASYRVGVLAHNHHFLWAAASMAGQQQVALAAAEAVNPVACGPARENRSLALMAHYAALPSLARVRFGLWDDMLRNTPPPDSPSSYALALWYFARATAALRLGDTTTALREQQYLQRVAARPGMANARIKNVNPVGTLLRIAQLSLRADFALAAARPAEAVSLLRESTAAEDSLAYDEPHLWLAPTRHALGAALLAAGQPAEAEQVYRQDLAHYPANGWSLQGLALAQTAQGLDAAAASTSLQANLAFAGAERRPTGSRY